MNKKISFLVTLGLGVFLNLGQAQEITTEGSAFSDNIQQAFIVQVEKGKEEIMQQLDSIKSVNGHAIEFSNEDILIAQRIQRIQKTIPLEYNERVKAYLDKYISRNYKPYMEKLLGLGQYYFPIYDKIFEEQGIPEEVKYLSVVESSLNPHTVSTSGAVGPWQFIYGTAKIYNLAMDGSYDERKDVYSSSYAVTTYLKEAYDEFNDWLLALASYNCGRGCVRRAIQRSGLSSPSYWELSPFLPKETQNYIPKYVAMTYVLNHAELYGLQPQKTNLLAENKVMMLNKSISLDKLAGSLGLSLDVLKEFNPAYKKGTVYASNEKPRRLVLPYQANFSDSLIYAALNNQIVVPEIKQEYAVDAKFSKNIAAVKKSDVKAKSSTVLSYVTHTVRKGDTLSDIAQKYRGATVSRLRSDNNLRGSNLRVGQKLKVYKGNS